MIPNENMSALGIQNIPATGNGRRLPYHPATSRPMYPDKTDHIRQHLVVLLHAEKCQKSDARDSFTATMENGINRRCTLPHCSAMKGVIHHMNICSNGKLCTYAHCGSSRQILMHWRSCQKPDCRVCAPLKSSHNAPSVYKANFTNGSSASVENAYSVSAGTSNIEISSGLTALSDSQECNVSLPNVANVVRDWHGQINMDFRRQILTRLLSNIIEPSSNSRSLVDKAKYELVTHVKNIEKEIFEKADDIEDYLRLVNESYCKHRKELQESREHKLHSVPNCKRPRIMSNNTIDGLDAAPQANFRSGNGALAVSGFQNPERRKQMQHQLLLLLHSNACKRKMTDLAAATEKISECPTPHCTTMKQVLQHMNICKSGRNCTYVHCASSGQIMTHWKSCKKEGCIFCMPLRNIVKTSPDGSNGAEIVNFADGVQARPSEEPAENTSPVSREVCNPPLYVEPMIMPVDRAASPSSTIVHGQFNLQKSSARPSNLSSSGGDRGHKLAVNLNLQKEDVAVSSVVKEWRCQVTEALRNEMRGKLLTVVLPSQNLNVVSDAKKLNQVIFAKNMEQEMFDKARNKEEYFRLLDEHGPIVQKELQDKIQALRKRSLNAGAANVVNKTGCSDIFEKRQVSVSQNSSRLSFTGIPTVKSEPLDSLYPNSPATSSSSLGLNGFSKVKTEEGLAAQCHLSVLENTCSKKESVKTERTFSQGLDRNFGANKLRKCLLPVWKCLYDSEEAMPFREPVDPVLLNIPDYPNIVKKPMDLKTISEKMENWKYNTAWEFCDDLWLMFENAWLYNRKNSKVYKLATKLSEVFIAEMDPVMQQMGYCCSRKLSFTPVALFCYGASMCTIAREQPYMLYEQNTSQFGITVSERYVYCLKCFEKVPPEGVSLSESSSDTNMAAKDRFIQIKNDAIVFEPFEECKHCHRRWHRICALHDDKVFPNGFICNSCRKHKSCAKPENMFTARRLPHNKLSSFIEGRVNSFIQKKSSEKCEVIIRTLCVQDKEMEVKPKMRAKYSSQGFPDRFPYRTKAIFAFEVIDGVEVCFFGLHVQEYGSNTPNPNQRRVYIAYLDSVNFFQPRELRTDVYHEILLAYLDYVKRLGYAVAHIWACPPSEGDDYIFHCHPREQKLPKPKRLQDWYKKMFDKGIRQNIVVDYKDIYSQAVDDDLTTPMQLPYFEGDFWPNVIEDCIRADSEKSAKKKTDAANWKSAGDGVPATIENEKKKSSKIKKTSKINKKKHISVTGNEVADRLYSQFEKHKDVFFTVRLVSRQSELALGSQGIFDPDPLLSSELMDGRDDFLTKAREDHWEFSSLRRAKFSTLAFCYALHEMDNKESYTCNKCSQNAAVYHCSVCEDYDLCDTCYKEHPHDHQMNSIKPLMSSVEGSRSDKTQRSHAVLVHSCQCHDGSCRLEDCHRMKKAVQHMKMCKHKYGKCPKCKMLLSLCFYHARKCSRDMCAVPFCRNMRQTLLEQKRSLARRADMMMRRRMDCLQAVSQNDNS